ncbi:MAG: hypothetical protein KGD64_03310 [Candidatus Heimdallarchaeota archaeon]|nr:hypothetical protein [Candidatus Heimdallarchaeota archaeon]
MMRPSLSFKQIIIVLVISLLMTLGTSILITLMVNPYTVHIRIVDAVWPPEVYIVGDDYIDYDIYMLCEIWNPSKKTLTHHTPNSNLLDPQMEIELSDNYTYVTGYFSWIHLTKHKIEPGVSLSIIVMFFSISNYNLTIFPEGNYTVWSGIVGNPEQYGAPPFNFTSYKTIMHHNQNESYLEFEPTPENWGEIDFYDRDLALTIFWTLTGGELVTITIIYIIKRNKKKLENLAETQI